MSDQCSQRSASVTRLQRRWHLRIGIDESDEEAGFRSGHGFGVRCAWRRRGRSISSNAPNRSIAKIDSVQYLFPAQVTVTAGKPIPVALHFRIAQGLHINSHTPSDDYLIPTTFSIPDGAGVRLDAATYPAGTAMTLPADPTDQAQRVYRRVHDSGADRGHAGQSPVQAKLRYQACDQNQCLPPKTITVPIDVIAK